MERLSSAFFMISLLSYYILKLMKMKKTKIVKFHITTGAISIILMLLQLFMKIGQADFLKYLGFSVIMALIGLTGYVMKKNPRLYRKLHLIFTIMFFVYLIGAINFL